MNEIILMYADGVIGNQGLLSGIGALTAGVFNYMRSSNSPPYSLKQILGNSYGYIFSEVETNPDEALLLFMTQAKGFSMDKFNKE